jgi:hypothetical protein
MSKPGTTFKVGYNINLHESCDFGPGADAIVQDFDEDQVEVREDGSVIIRYRFTIFEFDEPVSDLDEAFDRIQAAWESAPDAPVQIEIFSVVRAETSEMGLLQAMKNLCEKHEGKWTDAKEQRLRELEELQALHQWDPSTLYNQELPHNKADLILSSFCPPSDI